MFAGVSVLVCKRIWKPKHVVRTCDTHSKLQGRICSIRLRNWQEVVTAIVTYWSPKPNDVASRAAQAETLHSLAEWLRKRLHNTQNEALNDRMGIARDDDDEDQAVTGDLFPGKERLPVGVQRHSEGMEARRHFPAWALNRIDHSAAPATLTRLDLLSSPCQIWIPTSIGKEHTQA